LAVNGIQKASRSLGVPSGLRADVIGGVPDPVKRLST